MKKAKVVKIPKFTLALKKAWVKALRSGRFTQGQGALKTKFDKEPPTYCCLGVLAKVAGMKFERDSYADELSVLGDPCKLPTALLTPRQQQPLIDRNDNGVTFPEIANYIEKKVFPLRKAK